MGQEKAISLKILMHNGSPEELVTIRNDEWPDGEITMGPRSKAEDVAKMSFNGGVYILYSQFSCAIFPVEDLEHDLIRHLSQEKWWYKIAVITAQSSVITIEESVYLASVMSKRAKKLGSLLYDDNLDVPLLDAFQSTLLSQFAESAASLLYVAGSKILSDSFAHDAKSGVSLIVGKEGTRLPKPSRKGAKDYVLLQGIEIDSFYNYSSKRTSGEYWINASVESLHHDWTIIFNDDDVSELIIAKIPAFSLMPCSKDRPGLLIRPDKNCVDVGIDATSFKDRKSDVDFSPFLKMRIKYT